MTFLSTIQVIILSLSHGPNHSNKDFFDRFLDSAPAIQASQLKETRNQFTQASIRSVESRLDVPTIVWFNKFDSAKKPQTGDLETLARHYLNEFGALYRYPANFQENTSLVYIHDTGRGPIIAKFAQVIDGVEVYGSTQNVLFDRSLRLQGITGYLFPHQVNHKTLTYTISEMEAITLAFGNQTDEQIAESDLVIVGNHTPYNQYDFRSGTRSQNDVDMATPARIKRVHYADELGFTPAYYIEIDSAVPQETNSTFFAYIISGQDGSLLHRHNLTANEDFSYRVAANDSGGMEPWDGPHGNDGSPHPTGVPDGFQQPFQPELLVTLQNLPFSQNDPWLPNGATETDGNNVDAYIDRFGGDGYQPGAGDFRAATTAANEFDRMFDHGLSPIANTTQQQAAVTQLFYVCNYLHDDYYDAGFDEAAGNAQFDNFGRGGLGGDDMRSECQDGTGTDNANMSTPADGGRPRMQMYVFSGPNPDRDGTIDNGISGHEWGHYFHHRLNPFANNPQSGAMSEGWGDIIATIMAVEEGDNYGGAYATGAYATYQFFILTSFVDNFYFGIRRFPYSTNMALNPLTFGHIDPAFGNPGGAPISPLGWENNGNAEVHNAGEVWAQMIWECYHDLIMDRVVTNAEDFQDVKNLMQEYLVASLKLSPVNPTFVEARDAVLMAAAANNEDDFNTFSAAFARRGIGVNAVAPDRDSLSFNGVVEDYNVIPVSFDLGFIEADLDDSIDSCDDDGILDTGEAGLLTVTLKNNGFGALNSIVANVTSGNDVSFSNGGVINFSTAVSGTEVTGSLIVRLNSSIEQELVTLNIAFEDTVNVPVNNAMESWVGHYDLSPTLTTDDAEGVDAWDRQVDVGIAEWAIIADGNSTSGTHAYFIIDTETSLDSHLISPEIAVPAVGDFTFSFEHRHRFETGAWDGGVLEISTDGVNWTDIGASATPGYNGVITTNPSSPISDQPAFVDDNPDYPNFTSVNVDLGTTYNSQTVRVRFRIGCDGAAGSDGWWLDDISFPTAPPIFPVIVSEPTICDGCFVSVPGALLGTMQKFPTWPLTNMIQLVETLQNFCP